MTRRGEPRILFQTQINNILGDAVNDESIERQSNSFANFADDYFNHVYSILKSIDIGSIDNFVKILLNARENKNKIFFIGNGGSASTASHFANDLTVGTRQDERPFPVISLTDNVAVITAIGNDFGYEHIFSKQLAAYGTKGDVLVAISASGNSPNLLKAIERAKLMDILTVGITAFDGGRLMVAADRSIHVPTGKGEYGPAEDAHLILNHLIVGYLAKILKRA